VINNSFVFRDVATTKSPHYLAARFRTAATFEEPPVVVTPAGGQNLDFKRFHPQQPSPPYRDLADAIEAELPKLGILVFSLISTITDDRVDSIAVNCTPLTQVKCDPSAPTKVSVSRTSIVLKDLEDEEALWELVQTHYRDSNTTPHSQLEQEFARAIESLRASAASTLNLPSRRGPIDDGVLDQVVSALRVYHRRYDEALERRAAARTDSAKADHFNEILRIAYAFGEQSESMVRLVVSICDLKPLVLWMTIDRHYALTEAFRSLPWTKTKNKPSFVNYNGMIGDSRNHAFHNVLPFQKALNFVMPDSAITGAELRIFSEYGNSKHKNQLTYSDREVADVMLSFNRAKRRPTPESFWQANSGFMKATIDLLSDTNAALKELYRAF
jgi:hypothetical protein